MIQIASLGLDVQELLDLSSIYAAVVIDHVLLVELASAHRITVAEAYYDCIDAQRQIARNVRSIREAEANKLHEAVVLDSESTEVKSGQPQ